MTSASLPVAVASIMEAAAAAATFLVTVTSSARIIPVVAAVGVDGDCWRRSDWRFSSLEDGPLRTGGVNRSIAEANQSEVLKSERLS